MTSCGAALLVTGCVETIAQHHVETALRDAGLSDRNAQCMAGRMVDRLSIAQLRKLDGLKAQNGEAARPASLDQFVQRIERVGDAEVLTVTASSAALCAIGFG